MNPLIAGFTLGVAVTFVSSLIAFKMVLGWLEDAGQYHPPHGNVSAPPPNMEGGDQPLPPPSK